MFSICVSISSAQNINPRRPFKPISFSNYQPLWNTTLQDSSLIDRTVRRNHLNCFDRNEKINDKVSNDKLYYSLFIQRESDFEGTYVGSIDIKTGKRIWNKYFSLATQDRQEFTQSMIIEDDKIELLGMKTLSLYGSSLGPISLFDSTCWMTKRVYNKETGNLMVNHQSDPTDPNTQKMAWGGVKTIKHSKIFKINDNTYRYVHHHKIRPENTIDFCDLDEKGVRLDTIESIKVGKRLDRFNYFQLANDRFLFIEDDFLPENNKYSLHILNDNFDTISSVRTIDFIPIDANVQEVNEENEYIILSSTTYEPTDTFRLNPNKLLWIVDFSGNTLKKVKMEDETGNYMFKYVYSYDKVKNDLIVVYANGQGLFEPPKYNLKFYSTDISDKLQLKKVISVDDSLKVIRLERLTKTLEGNYIILWEEYDIYQKNDRYDDIDIYSVGMSYVCFDPNTLGLVSSSVDVAIEHKVSVYPNPTSNFLKISCLDCDGANLEILDLNGKPILHSKLLLEYENSIDISHLESGIYFYNVRSTNKNLYSGKWIKI